MGKRRSHVVWLVESERFKQLVISSKSYKEILLKLNLNPTVSGNYKTLKKRIIEDKITLPDKDYSYLKTLDYNKTTIDDFCYNSNKERTSIRKFILNNNLFDYKCTICNNNGIWLDKSITLHLDHINGINNDHRLENLRFLCPNCHSQTSNFSGRNRLTKKCDICFKFINKSSTKCSDCKKFQSSKHKESSLKQRKVKNRPSLEILEKEIEEIGVQATGKKYGVTIPAVWNWIKVYKRQAKEKEEINEKSNKME